MVDANMDALALLRKRFEEAGGDMPREMPKAVVDKLMSAEVNALCNDGGRSSSPPPPSSSSTRWYG
jgi:hypothetical protein